MFKTFERHEAMNHSLRVAACILIFIVGDNSVACDGLKVESASWWPKLSSGGSKPVEVQVFIHVHAQGHWWRILNEQLQALMWSGLLERASAVHVFINVLSPNYPLGEARELTETYGSTVIVHVHVQDGSYERLTLQSIRGLVGHQTFFLYMHSKGVTRSAADQVCCRRGR